MTQRFKFCKKLDDKLELAPIRAYLRKAVEMKVTQARMQAELTEAYQDLVDHCRQHHRVPRGLTVVINPTYLDELGFVVLHSQEVETVEDEQEPEQETMQ